MKPVLSEFSYGYALTEDMVNGLGPSLKAAPVFPSLYQEGKVGYDLSLQYANFALFVQFKLSDLMSRGQAVEARKGLLKPPYYRMHIWRRTRSEQHDLLVSLSEKGEMVFYAAPAFCTVSQLNDAYLARKVADSSAFFDPKIIGRLPDDDEHYVAFTMTPRKAFFCSDPHETNFTPGSSLPDYLLQHLQSHSRKSMRADMLAERINARLLGILNEQSNSRRDTAGDPVRLQDPLASAVYLSRAYFGCELYFVRQTEQ